jgi:hypothetical protein
MNGLRIRDAIVPMIILGLGAWIAVSLMRYFGMI